MPEVDQKLIDNFSNLIRFHFASDTFLHHDWQVAGAEVDIQSIYTLLDKSSSLRNTLAEGSNPNKQLSIP